MSSCQYCDLCKLSEIFKCKSLIKFLDDYSKKNSDNIDFIINAILELNSTINDDALINNTFSVKLENYLRSNFKKCIQNQNFSRLPISLIYRIIEKLDPNLILYDDLYDFISKSISDRHTLFSFIDLKQLSDEKFDDLYKKYTTKKDFEVIYYKFLQIDLEFINTMKENEKKLKILSNEVQKENNKLSSSVKLLEKQIKSLKDKNDEITKENQELTTKVSQLQIQNKELVDSNKPDEKIIKSLISFISTYQTLCSLCESQNLELIKFFLTYNTNTVNSKYCQGSIEKIPLTIAIEKGNIELVKLLLSIPNIDVNVLLTTYYTKQNIQQSNIGSNGERIDARETIIKKTPLIIAIEKRNAEIVQLLLNDSRINTSIQSSIQKKRNNNYWYVLRSKLRSYEKNK